MKCFYCQEGTMYQTYKAKYLDRVGFIMNCYKCSQIFFRSYVNKNDVIETVPDEDLLDLYKDYDAF